jgi:hypothetical protein
MADEEIAGCCSIGCGGVVFEEAMKRKVVVCPDC